MDDLTTIPEYDFGSNYGEETVDLFSPGSDIYQPTIELDRFAEAFLWLLEPAAFKVAYGGRGSGKTKHFAIALVLIAVTRKKRILCCREYQSSIAESVHYELVEVIDTLKLNPWFNITDRSITCIATGSEFIFKGLKLHINEIKSTAGIDIVWIEEGQATSRQSLTTLIPTIRADNAEIWISYNPLNENDPVHQDFVVKPIYPAFLNGEPYCVVKKVNWQDNPWFPKSLETLRQLHLNDGGGQDLYMHIWEGQTLQISEAMIFKGKWEVREYDDAPVGTRFHHGMDFGFANDPSVAIRCWVNGPDLMIDYAIYGVHTEIDELAGLAAGSDMMSPPRWTNARGYSGIPTLLQGWPLKCDNARPETISFLSRQGIAASPADKWEGCVEDGIQHLRGFRKIVIHPRCDPRFVEEAMMYRFKVDPKTNEVLPIIVDKFNHGWDAVRYSLDGYIQQRGELGMWRRLAQDV